MDQTNQQNLDFNETGKFSNYSLASGYSPAIGTEQFKTNITLKMKNKELLKKYGKIDFNSLNRQIQKPIQNNIVLNELTGIAVE